MFLVTVFTLPKHVNAVRAWFDEPEQWRFTATIHTTDTGIERILRQDRPHVIVTVAVTDDGLDEATHYWPKLPKLEYNMRKRWLSYRDPSELRTYHFEHCNLKSNVFFTGQNDNPTVCVFITTYNSGSKIQRPIEALLNQTYKDWKCIIFDDSDDNGATWRMLEQDIKPMDHRIKLYKPSDHSGMIGAVKGEAAMVASLHGDVVAEVDHDDYFSDDLLEKLTNGFRDHPDIDFIHTPWSEPYETDPAKSHYYGRHVDKETGFYTGEFDGWGYGYGSSFKQWHRGNWINATQPCPINNTTIKSLMSCPNHLRAWRSKFYQKIGGHNPNLNVADDFDILNRTYEFGRMGILQGGARYFQPRNAGNDNFTNIRADEIEANNDEQGEHREYALMRRSVEIGMWPVPLPKQVKVPTIPSHDPNAKDAHAAIDALSPEARLAMGEHMAKVFPLWTGLRHENWKNIMVDKRADRVIGVRPSTISVVIPTFDRSKLLKRALQSVFTQTYEDIEVIVVGDHCPTLARSMNTWAKETWLKPHLDKLHWWNLSRNAGGVGAYPRNYAVYHLVQTEWIAYLDDDNWWEPDHLESLMDVVKSAAPAVKVAWAFSSMQVNSQKIYATCPKWGRVDTSSILHRRSLLERYGMWRHKTEHGDIIYATDWDLVGRWARAGEHWAATVKTTLRYNCDFNTQNAQSILDMVPGDQNDVRPGQPILNGLPMPGAASPSSSSTFHSKAFLPSSSTEEEVGGASSTSILAKMKRKKKKEKKEKSNGGDEEGGDGGGGEKNKKKKKKKKKLSASAQSEDIANDDVVEEAAAAVEKVVAAVEEVATAAAVVAAADEEVAAVVVDEVVAADEEVAAAPVVVEEEVVAADEEAVVKVSEDVITEVVYTSM